MYDDETPQVNPQPADVSQDVPQAAPAVHEPTLHEPTLHEPTLHEPTLHDDTTRQDAPRHDPAPPPPAPAAAVPAAAVPAKARRLSPTSVLAGALAGALAAGGVVGIDRATRSDSTSTTTVAVAASPATTAVGIQPVALTSEFAVTNLVNRISPSVVRVMVDLQQQTPFGTQSGKGEGTGVILTADGELLTNAHVVESATRVKVQLSDGSTHTAKVLGTDTDDDIAVVKIDNITGLKPAVLGASGKAQVGEPVVAVGDALGLDGAPTVTTGIVSGLNRTLDDTSSSLHGLIQTDAAINHGNSGGPLLNTKGEVIGINTAIAPDANNIGFAIAIDNVKPLLAKLAKGQAVTSDNTYLGISSQTVTDDVRTSLGLKVSTGAVVMDVGAGTAAQKAGLKVSDVIMTANGSDITSSQQLTSIVHHLSPGQHLKLVVNRKGSTLTIDAVLGSKGAVPA